MNDFSKLDTHPSCFAGAYSDLVKLVNDAYCDYTVDKARANARHCREMMKAYREIATMDGDLDLANLTSLQKKYKSHRCVLTHVHV